MYRKLNSKVFEKSNFWNSVFSLTHPLNVDRVWTEKKFILNLDFLSLLCITILFVLFFLCFIHFLRKKRFFSKVKLQFRFCSSSGIHYYSCVVSIEHIFEFVLCFLSLCWQAFIVIKYNCWILCWVSPQFRLT